MVMGRDAALASLGWGRFQLEAHAGLVQGDATPARVVRQEGTGLLLDTGLARFPAVLSGRLKHAAAGPADLPVVGDWVMVSVTGDGASATGVVHQVVPRQSLLARRRVGARVDVQLMAANVDVALITWGLDREPNLALLERAMLLAKMGGVLPAIVLTKVDACGAWASHAEAVRARLPISVWPVSTVSGLGVENLVSVIGLGRTAALFGPSGAGKSSLVNHLLGSDATKIGAVRGDDRRGRHTTTHRELFRLPAGGFLLDGPGVREFGLLDDAAAVEQAFPDIASLAAQCTYAACPHDHEPGCAVLGAIRTGALDAQRLTDFRKLVSESRGERTRRTSRREKRSKRWGPPQG